MIFNKKASITLLDEAHKDSVVRHLSHRPAALRVQHISLKFLLPIEMSSLSTQEAASLEQAVLPRAVWQTLLTHGSFFIRGCVCVSLSYEISE